MTEEESDVHTSEGVEGSKFRLLKRTWRRYSACDSDVSTRVVYGLGAARASVDSYPSLSSRSGADASSPVTRDVWSDVLISEDPALPTPPEVSPLGSPHSLREGLIKCMIPSIP